MHPVRWTLAKLPMKEMAWMLSGELQAPPSIKSHTRLGHRSRDRDCRDSRRPGIGGDTGKWYYTAFPEFDWY